MTHRVQLMFLRSGGSCCGEGIDAKIQRTYPTILEHSDNVREGAWQSICDEIDFALKPLRPVKNRMTRMVFLLFVLMLAVVISIALLIRQVEIQLYLGTIWYLLILSFIIVLPFALFCYMKGTYTKQMDKVFENVKKICLNRSNQFSDVNFNLIRIRQTDGKKVWYVRYILVSVAGVPDEDDDNRTEPTGTDVSLSALSEEDFRTNIRTEGNGPHADSYV